MCTSGGMIGLVVRPIMDFRVVWYLNGDCLCWSRVLTFDLTYSSLVCLFKAVTKFLCLFHLSQSSVLCLRQIASLNNLFRFLMLRRSSEVIQGLCCLRVTNFFMAIAVFAAFRIVAVNLSATSSTSPLSIESQSVFINMSVSRCASSLL